MYGKRHGKGTYTYHDGGKYDGEWVDDKVRSFAYLIARLRAAGSGVPRHCRAQIHGQGEREYAIGNKVRTHSSCCPRAPTCASGRCARCAAQ